MDLRHFETAHGPPATQHKTRITKLCDSWLVIRVGEIEVNLSLPLPLAVTIHWFAYGLSIARGF
jgi:hypothetical protein